MDLYLKNALQCSKKTTQNYSTSFSLGVKLLDSSVRDAIYAIYGFVRFADEIVDTFYGKNQEQLLDEFRQETFTAIDQQISTNPIIHSFQWAVNKYHIEHELIEAFLHSMKMDLTKTNYTANEYKNYIYGSAEVVGLMCLRVFCANNKEHYKTLLIPARKLGEAFQKVNFLRDIEADFEEKGRTYFPNVNFDKFTELDKNIVEDDIENDFSIALEGIAALPENSKLGVLLAYKYYLVLLKKIKNTGANELKHRRIRVNNLHKIYLLIITFLQFKIGLKTKVSLFAKPDTIKNEQLYQQIA